MVNLEDALYLSDGEFAVDVLLVFRVLGDVSDVLVQSLILILQIPVFLLLVVEYHEHSGSAVRAYFDVL